MKKVYCLHVAIMYLNGMTMSISDKTIEFEAQRERPRITPKQLENIRNTIQSEFNCESVTILFWQWYDQE